MRRRNISLKEGYVNEASPLLSSSDHEITPKSNRKVYGITHYINQRTIPVVASTASSLLHVALIAYALVCTVYDLPTVGMNIAQPISLTVFAFFHGWLTLGILQSLSFAVISMSISLVVEHFLMVQKFKLTYENEIYGERSFSVPIDVPVSYYMIMYLCFSVSEIILYGRDRIRSKEHVGIRTPTLSIFLVLPLLSSIIMLCFEMNIVVVANSTGMWSYDFNIPIYDKNETRVIDHVLPQSIYEGDFFYGVSLYHFYNVCLIMFSTVLLYLLVEYVIDRSLIFLENIYSGKKLFFGPILGSAHSFFLPPTYGLQPNRYVSHRIIHRLSFYMPVACTCAQFVTFIFTTNPHSVRMISITTTALITLLALVGLSKP
ncbi:hypothetical protein AKO1_011505 [Acrasis kona]|uniref:Odorant receptor n=1 Tax=Acrasis kona TaxID=1008807 RepID=A0AAW2Z1S2_9EUKA